MLKLYTYQIYKTPKLVGSGIECLDSTVKSGERLLAPTWAMVEGIKTGSLSHEAYTEQYLEILERHYKQFPEYFHLILQKEHLALGCYCNPKNFCHRYLLKDWLIEKAMQLDYEVEDMGEAFP